MFAHPQFPFICCVLKWTPFRRLKSFPISLWRSEEVCGSLQFSVLPLVWKEPSQNCYFVQSWSNIQCVASVRYIHWRVGRFGNIYIPHGRVYGQQPLSSLEIWLEINWSWVPLGCTPICSPQPTSTLGALLKIWCRNAADHSKHEPLWFLWYVESSNQSFSDQGCVWPAIQKARDSTGPFGRPHVNRWNLQWYGVNGLS